MVNCIVWIVFILSENKLESHKRVCGNKAPFIIYAYLECTIERIDGCKNNPENLFTTFASETYSIMFFNGYNIFI